MIIVMGVPGAGKSTVLAAASNSGYRMANYGDLMFEIASKEFGIKHRDELRKLDTSKQRKVQAAVGDALSKMGEKTILDTHCSIATPKGYLPGLPYSLLVKLHVSQLVLISAPIKEIIGRRKSDTTRVRDAESEESLSEHDAMNKAFLATYSCLTGAPALVILNKDGGLGEAQKKLLSIL